MSSAPSFDHDFFRTTGVQDFKIPETEKTPAGYPAARIEDSFSGRPFAETFKERKSVYISHVLKNPGTGTVKGFFYELIRLSEEKGPVHMGKLFGALHYIGQRKDCADFVMTGILRMVYQLSGSSLMTDELMTEAKEAILNFKYWPDEPGTDSMCYWTENHHILFSVNEYLAGQLYPEGVFRNSGMTGREKMKKAEPRIRKWLELRFKTGFIEWLSNVYYDEDMPALLNLIDFARDEKLTVRAAMVTDLMFYDMAVNSYYGQFVCSHGRTYTEEKKSALKESTTDTTKLMFGMGVFANLDNMTAPLLALTENYRMPEVFFDIAADTARPEIVSRQRCSIRFRDAKKWGYGKKDLTSAMGLLSAGGYSHPRTINHMARMLDAFGWWENKFFQEFLPFRKAITFGKHIGLTNLIALVLKKDMSRNAMTESNVYSYRTPDYMLSTAQDYRKSCGGDQHHIWQASLAPEAVCFTTHPGGYGLTAPDAYWHGNGFMPKALQQKNVSIVMYKTPTGPTVVLAKLMRFTHAWFPKDKFDEVTEENRWIFARKDRGYLALYSHAPWHWQDTGAEANREVIAPGLNNVWICEMGRGKTHGTFEEFIKAVSSAPLKIRRLNGTYHSPSQGKLEFGWNRKFRKDGAVLRTRNYPRYDNPWGRTDFASDVIKVKSENHSLELDFIKGTRVVQ